MITADKIRKLAHLDTVTLERAVRRNYPKDQVLRSEFVGITNGGQFCYKIVYPDQDAANGMATTKVFVDLAADEQPIGEY